MIKIAKKNNLMQNYWWSNLLDLPLTKHNNALHLGLTPIKEKPHHYILDLGNQKFTICLELVGSNRINILKSCLKQVTKKYEEVLDNQEVIHDCQEVSSVLLEIKAERAAQDTKWGPQNHSPIEWMAILMEEVGEASKEALDFHFYNPPAYGEPQNITELQSLRLRRYRKETLQVAAVAVQMMECYDRNLKKILMLLETKSGKPSIT